MGTSPLLQLQLLNSWLVSRRAMCCPNDGQVGRGNIGRGYNPGDTLVCGGTLTMQQELGTLASCVTWRVQEVLHSREIEENGSWNKGWHLAPKKPPILVLTNS